MANELVGLGLAELGGAVLAEAGAEDVAVCLIGEAEVFLGDMDFG